MKIAVVGAAGMVGSRVVDEAASRGHELVAVFRIERPHHTAVTDHAIQRGGGRPTS
ncbi:NAD-dependent epimerase/dehydratase family protein [Nocardia vinacea]|uniref:NAD-dependent epimerase/dehydratase family protein n=1 Tax=Nocardia vinacea TaxID=96468 RepID=UPI001FDEC118|nr:NAD-dependent epimerase/dehydratase family protein [Nocardia vinacea]